MGNVRCNKTYSINNNSGSREFSHSPVQLWPVLDAAAVNVLKPVEPQKQAVTARTMAGPAEASSDSDIDVEEDDDDSNTQRAKKHKKKETTWAELKEMQAEKGDFNHLACRMGTVAPLPLSLSLF